VSLIHTHHTQENLAILSIDHRMRPETRAMLAAMSSRMPAGGVRRRYDEIVHAVATDIQNNSLLSTDHDGYVRAAESALTTSVPPKVQEFMNAFVGNYGHSSVLELTGSPTIFVEGISWYTAWLSFDGPLVKGQEFSTRAKAFKNWPVCYEATDHPGLVVLHRDWLHVFEAEVDWWQGHLSVPSNREKLGISDNEPFRPAYDMARWALPGTIATGFAHTANVRDMGRVIASAKALAYNCWREGEGNSERPYAVWEAIAKAYDESLPALAGYSLRTALTSPKEESEDWHRVPGHLLYWQPFDQAGLLRRLRHLDARTFCELTSDQGLAEVHAYVRDKTGGYIDPSHNRTLCSFASVTSLAAARDWHRHRTMYPWTMSPVISAGQAVIHPAYGPRSAFAQERYVDLVARSSAIYRELQERGDHYRAILALPLGAACTLQGYGGLRDMLYMLELRSKAHGTNFEYRQQAQSALDQLLEEHAGESL
jgi:hypothetical protein